MHLLQSFAGCCSCPGWQECSQSRVGAVRPTVLHVKPFKRSCQTSRLLYVQIPRRQQHDRNVVLSHASPREWGVQGCSAASGQLTFLGYAICLFVSGFPALILCERVDLEPCKLARGFGEHLLCIYTDVDGSRRRPLPSL